MDLLPVLSTTILVATLGTLLVACFSYAAYKGRERRRPTRRARKGEPQAVAFFHRWEGSGPKA